MGRPIRPTDESEINSKISTLNAEIEGIEGLNKQYEDIAKKNERSSEYYYSQSANPKTGMIPVFDEYGEFSSIRIDENYSKGDVDEFVAYKFREHIKENLKQINYLKRQLEDLKEQKENLDPRVYKRRMEDHAKRVLNEMKEALQDE